MDKIKATAWESDLKGKYIAGYEIEKLIDYGKSAAVFKAKKGDSHVALKLFDDELIEKFGGDVQIARIKRELTLIGRSHPNMVKILDGGVDTLTNNHFIVMEFLDGPSLQKCLSSIPEGNVAVLTEQLAACCEYLEGLGLVHRDIKPANIVIMENFTRLVLLDFGVLKPVGETGLTDAGGIQSFVGTLQYSSPEFLLRDEDDTIEGWRALSVYQIGGVLHDLIMRKPLFQEFSNPYARLVNAVQNNTPIVISSTAPSYLVETCQAALIKDPKTRLQLVGWRSFFPPDSEDVGQSARQRVTQRSIKQALAAVSDTSSENSAEDIVEATINLIKVESRRIRNENTSALPPITVSRIPRDGTSVTIGFRPNIQLGIPSGLALIIEVLILDQSSEAIELTVSAYRGNGTGEQHAATAVSAFRGVFSPSGIAATLESSIYLAVDQVQLESAPGEGNALDLSALKVG